MEAGDGITQISVENLSFEYGSGPASRRALDGVSFSVEAGEYVCLLGGNGSGKSTLLSCLNGLLTPPARAVRVFDRQLRAFDPADEAALDTIRRTIATVMQNPDNQIVGLTVENDVAFGPENLGLDAAACEARVTAALEAVGLEALRRRPVQYLSGGERSRLALAGALAMNSDCLLLDEVCAMLDPENRQKILAILDAQHRAGKTILHITHDENEAARAGRCLVLDKGRLVQDLREPPLSLQAALTSAPQSAAPPHSRRAAKPPLAAIESRVAMENVSFAYPGGKDILSGLSLAFPTASITAITGPSGAGKSTLLKLVNALLLPTYGSVLVEGQDTRDRAVKLSVFRSKAALAVQNPESALFEAYVADDVAWGPRRQGLRGAALRERVEAAMEAAGLPFNEFADRQTLSLSGGEKRRAALAGVLALDSRIVLFDEGEAGLDAAGRLRFWCLLDTLKARGKTVIVTTHRAESAARADFILDIGTTHSTASQAPTASPPRKPRVKTGLEAFRFFQPEAGEKDTPLGRLGAGVKLLALLALASLVIAAKGALASPLILALTLLAGRLAGAASPRRLLAGFLAAWPWILAIALLQTLFTTPGDTSRPLLIFGPFTLTTAEALRAFSLAARLASLMALLSLYAATTPLRRILALFRRRRGKGPALGLYGLALTIALRFVPVLSEEAERIVTAQLSRAGGSSRLRTTIGMVVPLFLRALERSEKLAAAMLLRLYHP